MTVNLTWAADGYHMAIDSTREHHLVRDSLVESAYIVDGLPDDECPARLGCSKVSYRRQLTHGGSLSHCASSLSQILRPLNPAFSRHWTSFRSRTIGCEPDGQKKSRDWFSRESSLIVGQSPSGEYGTIAFESLIRLQWAAMAFELSISASPSSPFRLRGGSR